MTAAEAIITLLETRGGDKSICPSEAARQLNAENWRESMPVIREAAASLEAEGRILVTQKSEIVEIAEAKGPIRLRLK
ncbi:MAG: DUF3253 domain-containing protein [Pseudomonadota bacterium]